jgi:nicotinate phosphoribosyltransferase
MIAGDVLYEDQLASAWTYPAKVDALFADLYELTMMQAYLREGLSETAAFSLFVRRLPPTRNYLIACGLETVLDFLQHVKFSTDDISYLSSLSLFTPEFLDWLLDFHFTGDVFAVPEGTPVFGNEPILEIVAPLPQAQYFKTFVMNQIHRQTLLSLKSATSHYPVEISAALAAYDLEVRYEIAQRQMHSVGQSTK